jgi:endonuclease/exonuclease/phosphatase (EEP) superfamily protein YafD
METAFFIITIVLYVLGGLAILLTVLPFLKFGAWWIRIGDFPRLQIAVVCVAAAAFFLIFAFPLTVDEIIFIALLIACTIYQLLSIVPYLPFYPKQVEKSRVPLPKKVIRLLIFNVFIENRKYDKFLRLVQKMNPDVILLAEPDAEWLRNIAELEKTHPHFVKHPLDNAYGMALYSKLELVDPQLKFIIEDDIPSIHTGIRLRSNDVVNLYCVHPRPPIPPENHRSHERDAELLLVGKSLADDRNPTIIAGDLNDVAWSRTTKLFQKISGLLDPRIGRGLYNSFHAHYPLVRFPLDHVFHSNHFRLVELKRLKNIGSDHFPIYVCLSFEKTAEFTQEEPEAHPDDHLEAEETIREALELIEEERRQNGSRGQEITV